MDTDGGDVFTQAGPERANEATFENALRGLRATGASTGSRTLVELLSRHGSEEGAILDSYVEFVETSNDGSVKYLINMILDDERRHHRLLAEMANAIAWGHIKANPEPSTPATTGVMSTSPSDLTKQLLQFERKDARQLNRLRKRLRPFSATTVWALLVDLMILDTKKHRTILRFLKRHPGASP
jgi:hypothetical protein